jgi:hypothetical protein
MEIYEIILWVIFTGITVYWIIETRRKAASGFVVPSAIVNQCLLFTISIIAVPLFKISSYNLLWMMPSSLVLGYLFAVPPFSIIIYIPAYLFAILVLGIQRR